MAIGGLFAGESMFHRETDASKVALMALVQMLDDGLDRLIDTQWQTTHLASLGVCEEPREEYLRLLASVLGTPDLDFERAAADVRTPRGTHTVAPHVVDR